MTINYVFDVDGTLTLPRREIDPGFERWLREWSTGRPVFLITGSDKDKTIEQIGLPLWLGVNAVYQCAGNEVFSGGRLLRRSIWSPSAALLRLLSGLLEQNGYPYRYGNHIEVRTGLVNFSIVGRDCSMEQRKEYNEWDNTHSDRSALCAAVMAAFPELEARVGGQISIDIYPVGKNKGQIVRDLVGPIYFFGDRTQKGGNDYDLARLLGDEPNRVFPVNGPHDVREILEHL